MFMLEENKRLVEAMNEFGITREKASKRIVGRPTENAVITAAKELVGEAIIKRYDLWDMLFPNNVGYKAIRGKKLQKAGVDFEIFLEDGTSVYVDLKSNLGPDYHMTQKDIKLNATPDQLNDMGLVIELYQNGIWTNSSSKLTDYQLHVTYQDDGIYFALVPYEYIMKEALKHKKTYKDYGEFCKVYWPGDYVAHISNNGSGVYIKIPYDFTKIGER